MHEGVVHPVSPARGAAAGPRQAGFWTATATLWQREMVRFFRQRNRVIGALGPPIVFWLVLGSGLDRAIMVEAAQLEAAGDPGYLTYLFPGALVMILLFTAIFSTITVIEDRQEGFLQAVLVAPVSRLAIVLGKVMGGASVAALQGLMFLALWPLVGSFPGWGAMVAAAGAVIVLAIGLTALGLCFAWPMESTAGFHAVMNLVLMPMWFLSGALFPVSTAAGWLRPLMRANPLTYGHAWIASLLEGSSNVLWPAVVTIGFTTGAIGVAAWMAARPASD